MNIPLNVDWQQILLHLFNFTILFAVLYFLLYSPVKKFMDGREQHYREMDDKANAELQKAEDIKAEYSKRLDSAADEIASMKEAARKEAEESARLRLEQAQAEADKLIKSAKSSIERDRQKMISDARNEISDIVTNAVEKIVSEPDPAKSYDEFLAAAVRSGKHE